MKKKSVIALIGIMICLTGCSIRPNIPAIDGYPNEEPQINTGDDQYQTADQKHASEGFTEEPEKEPVSADEIEDYIDEVGMAYDGIEDSYQNPTVDAVLLNNHYLSDDEPNFKAKTREEKQNLEKYQTLIGQFKAYFKPVSIYQPKDGIAISISDHKLYEYRLKDTDIILSLAQQIQDIPLYEYYGDKEEASSGIKGIMQNIGAIAPNSAVTEEAAVEDFAASESYEDIEPEAMPMIPEETDWNTEEYKSFTENRFMSAKTSPFSTFGMDIDTASYANFRKKIFNGKNIPKDSIRTEEMMNYFDYDYADPGKGEKFGVSASISDTPWNKDTQLLKIGVKSEEADVENVSSNVVFLIDVSGSMFDPDKLPLVQKSFLMLLYNLDKNDKVSIVTYAGGDDVVCEGVSCDNKEEVTKDIVSLDAWGGTNGAAGIQSAYEIARKNFIDGGNNRVILATDGDLNLGLTSESDLVELIQKEKESGIFLSVLGVGQGNYKDSKMKALADNGNGNFAYIDSTNAATKALLKDFNSLMYTVAKDAKMQVEFNPAKIKGYRQIGYELRQLNAEDFADDTKDGAEIGSGQCVTVLYEIVPTDSAMEIPDVEGKYSNAEVGDSTTDELLTVSIRYKEPDEGTSKLMEVPVTDKDYNAKMDEDLSWAAGVAEVSQLLRDSEYKGTSSYDEVFGRLKSDSRITKDESRAQFLYMIKMLKTGKYEVTDEDEDYYW